MVGAHTKTNGDGKLPDDEVDIEALSDEEKTSFPSSAPLIIPRDEEQDNTDSQLGGNEAEVQYPGVVSEYDGVNCTIVNENEDEGQTEVMISKQIDYNADQDSEEDPTFAIRDLLERDYWEKHERRVYEQLQEKKQQDEANKFLFARKDPEKARREQEMQRLTMVDIFDKAVDDTVWQKADTSLEALQLQRLKANKIPLPVARFRVRGDYDEMDEFDGYDPEISRVFYKRFKVDLLSCDWQEPELLIAQSLKKKSRVFLTGSKQKKKKDKSRKNSFLTFNHMLIYTQKGALNKSSENTNQHGVLSFFKPDVFLEEERLMFKELFFAFGKDWNLVSKMMNKVKTADQLREFYENQKSSLFDSSKGELPRGYRDTVVQLPFDAHSKLQPVLKLARVITSSTTKPSIKDIHVEDEVNFPFPAPGTPILPPSTPSNVTPVHNDNNTNAHDSEKSSKKSKAAPKKTPKNTKTPKSKKKKLSSADSTAPATPTDHPETDNNTPPAKKPFHLNMWDMPLFLAEMEIDLDTSNDTETGPNPLWMFHATPSKTPKRKHSGAVSTKKSSYTPKLTVKTESSKDSVDSHDIKDTPPPSALPTLVPLSPSTSVSPSSSPVASPSFQSLPHTPPCFSPVPVQQYPPFKFSMGNAVFVYYKDPLVLPRDGYWVEGRVTQKRLTILNKKLFWEYKVLMVSNNEIDEKFQNKYHRESWFVEDDIRRNLCFGTQVFMFSEEAPAPKGRPRDSEEHQLTKSSSTGPSSSPLKSLVRLKRMHGAEEYVTMLVESLNHSNDKLLCGHNCTYSDMSINAPPSPPSSPGTPISPVSPADTLYYDYQELPAHHHSLSDYSSPLEERDLASLKKNVQSIFTHQLSTDSIDSSIILQRNFDSILTAIDTVVNNIYGTSPRRNGKNGMHSPYNGHSGESSQLSELMVEKLCIGKKLLLLECKRYLRIHTKEVVTEQMKSFDSSLDLQEALLKMQQTISPIVELRQLLLSVATERFDVFRDYLTEHSQHSQSKKPQYDQIVTE